MIVLVVLSILTAVAVPVYRISLTKSRTKDCKNQIIVIKAHVDTVMSGMEDNGVKIVVMGVTEGTVNGSGANKYWILKTTYSPTVGNMRIGQTAAEKDADPTVMYDHMKKSAMDATLFKTLFNGGETPVCPFDKNGTYGYRIYADGHVSCNCTDCPNYVA